MLPVSGGATSSDGADLAQEGNKEDRFLHARFQGTTRGVFDVFFDSTAAEQVLAGQAKEAANGVTYYDVWTSFSPVAAAGPKQADLGETSPPEAEKPHDSGI